MPSPITYLERAQPPGAGPAAAPRPAPELERQSPPIALTSRGAARHAWRSPLDNPPHWPGLSEAIGGPHGSNRCWHGHVWSAPDQNNRPVPGHQAGADTAMGCWPSPLAPLGGGRASSPAIRNGFKGAGAVAAPSPADRQRTTPAMLGVAATAPPCLLPCRQLTLGPMPAAEWQKPAAEPRPRHARKGWARFGGHAEREEEVMALCFGSSNPVDELQEECLSLTDLTTALHTPLLELGAGHDNREWPRQQRSGPSGSRLDFQPNQLPLGTGVVR